MKQLKEFQDEQGVVIASKIFGLLLEILNNEKNQELKSEENKFKIFSGFFANSPKQMMELFALLSEVEPSEYHCTGGEAIQNLMTLANDEDFVKLFQSQK